MNIEIKELNNKYGEVVIDGAHPYFVNALRRTLLAEVPKLAIHKVTFYDNTSALFDEIVSHRLGLLPIPTDPATLNRVGEMDEDGNPAYLVRYTLTKEGPCSVVSGDMECEDEAFLIADPNIPIVELLEGQRLILEAEAVLGQGTTHAKWQVCHAVGYKYYPEGKIDNRKISAEQAKEAVATTPEGILGLDGDKLVILDPINVNKADWAERVCGDGFKVEYNDRKFIFRFETDGSLKAEDALLKAVELLKQRFQEFGNVAGDL